MYSFIYTHVILYKLSHIIHVDFNKVNNLLYFISLFNLSGFLHTHITSPHPIPFLCLLASACFESFHSVLYAHMIIYICKYIHVLYGGHNYENIGKELGVEM